MRNIFFKEKGEAAILLTVFNFFFLNDPGLYASHLRSEKARFYNFLPEGIYEEGVAFRRDVRDLIRIEGTSTPELLPTSMNEHLLEDFHPQVSDQLLRKEVHARFLENGTREELGEILHACVLLIKDGKKIKRPLINALVVGLISKNKTGEWSLEDGYNLALSLFWVPDKRFIYESVQRLDNVHDHFYLIKLKHYNRRNLMLSLHQTALDLLLKGAQQGFIPSLSLLGLVYHKGHKAFSRRYALHQRDLDRAEEFYKVAAFIGSDDAAFCNLNALYKARRKHTSNIREDIKERPEIVYYFVEYTENLFLRSYLQRLKYCIEEENRRTEEKERKARKKRQWEETLASMSSNTHQMHTSAFTFALAGVIPYYGRS